MFTVDNLFEFYERYNRLPNMQKEILNHNSFKGTIDEYALKLGYGAPASMPFRKAAEELNTLGLITITVITKGRKTGLIKTFDIPSKEDWVKRLLEIPVDCLKKKKIGMDRRGNDLREIANKRRHEYYLNSKN